jgi:SH3-like domain-containing protein
LPRFVSLRASEVNLRTGPGIRYPIEWVFKRRDLPVEVVDEFESWRRIRDWEGTLGWVHQSMLRGRRTALVTGEPRVLRRAPEDTAPPVARVEPGVIGELEGCEPSWCRVAAGGFEGWLRREEFFGVYPNEALR